MADGMARAALAAALIASALALCACGDIPQPFRHEGVNEKVVPRFARGVNVRPVEGAPFAPALAEAMAAALLKAEVAATTRDAGPGAWVIEGHVGEDEDGVAILWMLTAPDRDIPANFTQKVPAALWNRPDPRSVNAIAAQAVAMLYGPLVNDTPPAAAPAQPKARIEPLAGLPGDGAAALVAAMRAALGAAGVTVVHQGGDYVVGASVSVTPAPGGQEALDVAWTVSRPDGTRLGSAAQRGTVPKGRLQRPWGTLAQDIAAGGADGVAQIIRAAASSR